MIVLIFTISLNETAQNSIFKFLEETQGQTCRHSAVLTLINSYEMSVKASHWA